MIRRVIDEYSQPKAWQIEKYHNYHALKHEADIIWRIVEGTEFSRALDIGCGRGRICLRLAGENRQKNIVAADASPMMVKIVSDRADEMRLSNILCVNADAQQLPFRNGSFELVICGQVVGHLADPLDFFRQGNSLLVNRGRLIISTGNSVSLCNIVDRYAGRDGSQGRRYRSIGEELQSRGFWRTSFRKLKVLLESSGFKIEKTYGADLLFYRKVIPAVVSKAIEKLSEFAPFCYLSRYLIISAVKTEEAQN